MQKLCAFSIHGKRHSHLFYKTIFVWRAKQTERRRIARIRTNVKEQQEKRNSHSNKDENGVATGSDNANLICTGQRVQIPRMRRIVVNCIISVVTLVFTYILETIHRPLLNYVVRPFFKSCPNHFGKEKLLRVSPPYIFSLPRNIINEIVIHVFILFRRVSNFFTLLGIFIVSIHDFLTGIVRNLPILELYTAGKEHDPFTT